MDDKVVRDVIEASIPSLLDLSQLAGQVAAGWDAFAKKGGAARAELFHILDALEAGTIEAGTQEACRLQRNAGVSSLPALATALEGKFNFWTVRLFQDNMSNTTLQEKHALCSLLPGTSRRGGRQKRQRRAFPWCSAPCFNEIAAQPAS